MKRKRIDPDTPTTESEVVGVQTRGSTRAKKDVFEIDSSDDDSGFASLVTTPVKQRRVAHTTENEVVGVQTRGSTKVRKISAEVDSERGSVISSVATFTKRQKEPTGSSALQTNGITPKKQIRFVESELTTPTTGSPARGRINSQPQANGVNADRSAKKKSTRLLIKHAELGEDCDNDELGDDLLAQQIIDGEEVEASEPGTDGLVEAQPDELNGDGLLPDPETPSKRPPRSRRKGKTKQRTPSPPPDLPPHEQYFFDNRPGGAKASDNTLPPSALISHEEYFEVMQHYKDPHESSLDFLHALHSRSFDQWIFELNQDFNICLHGYGSKRELLLDFASHISSLQSSRTITVLNGYSSSLTLRDILTTLATTIPSLANTKLGSQPSDMLATILSASARHPPPYPITLLINSIDGISLRRPLPQSILSQLASHPSFNILASADTPNFPLLWDSTLASNFNWIYHDCTTFQPLDVEISGGAAGGVVDEVNTLLGRSGRKMQGREGVMYVLKSLTRSARGLYGLLVAELLSTDEAGPIGDEAPPEFGADGFSRDVAAGDEMDVSEDDFEGALSSATPKGKKPKAKPPPRTAALQAVIEYRSLYNKAVTQFIATNEMSFRGLLKEFVDHEMVVIRRDGMGGEMLGVPWRREECEVLLEELMIGEE